MHIPLWMLVGLINLPACEGRGVYYCVGEDSCSSQATKKGSKSTLLATRSYIVHAKTMSPEKCSCPSIIPCTCIKYNLEHGHSPAAML